jgi:hypothetical protein
MGYFNRKQVTKVCSVFGTRPYTYNPFTGVTQWELLTAYIARKYISRSQAKTLIRKKWLAVSSFKNRLYVSEICPNEISRWFSE